MKCMKTWPLTLTRLPHVPKIEDLAGHIVLWQWWKTKCGHDWLAKVSDRRILWTWNFKTSGKSLIGCFCTLKIVANKFNWFFAQKPLITDWTSPHMVFNSSTHFKHLLWCNREWHNHSISTYGWMPTVQKKHADNKRLTFSFMFSLASLITATDDYLIYFLEIPCNCQENFFCNANPWNKCLFYILNVHKQLKSSSSTKLSVATYWRWLFFTLKRWGFATDRAGGTNKIHQAAFIPRHCNRNNSWRFYYYIKELSSGYLIKEKSIIEITLIIVYK